MMNGLMDHAVSHISVDGGIINVTCPIWTVYTAMMPKNLATYKGCIGSTISRQ